MVVVGACSLIAKPDRGKIPEDAPATSDVGGQGGSGGGTSSTSTSSTSSSSGAGGDVGGQGGSGGNVGGTGGTGGTSCVGPCCSIPDGEAAIVFTAPADHPAGLIGFSGWVECETPCESTSYASPIPGSVASFGDTTVVKFGIEPSGAVIRGLGTLHETETGGAIYYFAHYSGSTLVREGIYSACLGSEVVGGYTVGTFSGALSATDETSSPSNIMFTVP
ncbi:MAG: hypothetical protein ABIB04_02015 [Patescibacteria group bacterium]